MGQSTTGRARELLTLQWPGMTGNDFTALFFPILTSLLYMPMVWLYHSLFFYGRARKQPFLGGWGGRIQSLFNGRGFAISRG